MDGIEFKNIQISCDKEAFAAAVDTKGALYSWGFNKNGQLGHGDKVDRDLPIQVMQLRRKRVSSVAVGNQFTIALGKDVTDRALAKTKLSKKV